MLKLLWSMFFGFDFPLSEEESKRANECKQRTLKILHDALKKKDTLLVDNPAELSNQVEFHGIPLLNTDLVKDLISQLQKVTFKRGRSQILTAYVFPADGDGTVYLCPQFWKQHEFLQLHSRPGALIYQISELLGYEDSTKKPTEKMIKSQNKRCPISAIDIELAFSFYMVHEGSYTNGSYACCGETSRDTVCAESMTSLALRNASSLSEEECKSANEVKQRALNILNDALKKKDSLLVDDPDTFSKENKSRIVPLISTDLVKELISKLQKVTFKRNKDPETEKDTLAYVYPTSETDTIYLCQGFWELPEFLAIKSRPKTLIHEVAHLLGYGHTIPENEENVKKSQQHKLCPVSVDCIEIAFAIFMNHSETYSDGSYSCCGETSRDSLCDKSFMTRHIRDLSGMGDPTSLRFLRATLLLKRLSLLSIMEDLVTIINSAIPTQPEEDTVPSSSWITLPTVAEAK